MCIRDRYAPPRLPFRASASIHCSSKNFDAESEITGLKSANALSTIDFALSNGISSSESNKGAYLS